MLFRSKAKPGDSDLLIRLATTERRTGDFEQAITHYQMAIDLDPANLEARTVLLDTLVLMGAFKRAKPLADLWIEKYPATQTFKTNKVQILLSGYGDIEAAKALLAEIEPNPGPRYTTIVILVYLYERNYQGLIDILNRPPLSSLASVEAYKTWLLQNQADAYRHMGDDSNAEKLTRAALEAGTKYHSTSASNEAASLLSLALVYAGAGQFDQAMATIDRSIEIKPESADSLEGPLGSITRARILGMAGRHEESLAEIERLLNIPAGLNRWDLYLNPEWDFFRDDERFNELARPPNLKENGQ